MSIADDALAALSSGAKGAAAGMVLGPIGAGVGGAVGIASALLPGVAHLFSSDPDTVAKVTSAVQAVTGTADPAEQEVAAQDPSIAADLRVQLAQIAADRQAAQDQAQLDALKATLADVQNARLQALQLTQAGSKQAWGVSVVSVVVLLTFAVLSCLLLFRAVPEPSTGPLQILLGNLGTMAAGVVAFWIGSSAGSARKTEMLSQSVPAALLPQPAAVVPAADVPK